MAVLDSTSVYTALPSIGEDLEFAPGGLQWVITAYGLTVGGLLLLGGRIADLLGRRRVFIAAVALFGGASLLCGLAWSSEVLIAGRALQGLGAAILTPAGLSILMTIFPEGRDRNRALGIWGGLGGTGATAGLLLGGPITEGLGWAWIFFVNVPVCVAVLALCRALLPEGHAAPGRRQFDIAGAVTVTAALGLLVYALFAVAAGTGWLVATACVAAAVVCGALFVAVESRSPAPLVPMRIFRSRTLVGGNVVVLIAGMAVDGLLIVVTLYTQLVLGYSAIQFGLTMAVMTVMSVLGLAGGQHLVTRLGFRAVAVAGMALLCASCLLLTRVSADGGFARELLPGLLVFGAGMGAAFVSAQIAALAGVSSAESGLAAGIEETAFGIGTTLGVALASAVAVAHTDRLVAAGVAPLVAQTDGFRLALVVLAGLAAAGGVAALALLKARPAAGVTAG